MSELARLHTIERIRKAATDVNPGILEGEWMLQVTESGERKPLVHVERPVRLSDVLRILDRAVIAGDMPAKMQLQLISRTYGRIAGEWNLRHDNLEKQSYDAVMHIVRELERHVDIAHLREQASA